MERKTIAAIYLLLIVCSYFHPANAAIYQYRDEHGRLFLTDNPPNNKYKIVVTTKKECAGFDSPETNMVSQTSLLPSDDSFGNYINDAAKANNLDPFLIKSIIKVESDFDPKAKSSRGATGLMQLMPTTANLVECDDPTNARQNILGGSKYFRMMLNRFGGKIDYALAAYNAGPGNVDKYNGIPPFRETQNYVKKVNHYYKIYSANAGKTGSARVLPVTNTALSQKLNRAYKKFSDGDVEGALEDYRDIVASHPKNPQALYNLACILDMEHNYDEAIEIYKSALKHDPYLDKALYNIAVIYENIGEHSNSIKTWKQYIQIAKDEEKIIMAERYIKELTEYTSQKKRG